MFIKKTTFFLIIMFFLCSTTFSYAIQSSKIAAKEEKWLNRSCEDKNKILSNHLMLYLGPTIRNSLEAYYGQPKQSFNRIIYLDPHIPNDEIQIEAKTFTGPHNPPYGKDILTFSIAPDGNITLIDYQHTDINSGA